MITACALYRLSDTLPLGCRRIRRRVCCNRREMTVAPTCG